MPDVRYGGKNGTVVRLEDDPNLVVVRTRSRRSLRGGPVASPGTAAVDGLDLVTAFPDAGVEVYRVPDSAPAAAAEVRETLAQSDDVRFAGRGLVHASSQEPAVYTENLFVKFLDQISPAECEQILGEYGLTVKDQPAYATNAYFVAAPEGAGRTVFEIADRLLALPQVELCHPELVQRTRGRAAFAPQWHLARTTVAGRDIDASANVVAAHALSLGEGVTIAVLDDGFDLGHPEFATPGKIVAPRDYRPAVIDDDPAPADGQNHGTACAGVACADGRDGASGVAPRASLMPIRMPGGLGSVREGDAFLWAADHGADVISCSWGPPDGAWFKPEDPLHQQQWTIVDSTRLAIDYATTRGRGGKGCVVTFAAGNGNESVDLDGWAGHPRVLAVAACNDRSRRSVYSDFGDAVFCSFPSNDHAWPAAAHPAPLTPGIWTTDRRGRLGYNNGTLEGADAAGNYTNDFGGTSSACPGAAGVAALVLARNPALRADQVADVLRRACVPIDPQGGGYDARGHSRLYGYGRLDARRAVELADPAVSQQSITVTRTFNEPILNLRQSTVALVVGETAPLEDVRVSVEITHSWIGDLVVTLAPPAATGVAPIVLHEREGGAGKDLERSYDVNTVPALGACRGESPQGAWTLIVEDQAADDVGRIRGLTLELALGRVVRQAQPAASNSRVGAAR